MFDRYLIIQHLSIAPCDALAEKHKNWQGKRALIVLTTVALVLVLCALHCGRSCVFSTSHCGSKRSTSSDWQVNGTRSNFTMTPYLFEVTTLPSDKRFFTSLWTGRFSLLRMSTIEQFLLSVGMSSRQTFAWVLWTTLETPSCRISASSSSLMASSSPRVQHANATAARRDTAK